MTKTPLVQSGNLPSVELGHVHPGIANLMGELHLRSQGYSLSQEVVWSSQVSWPITPLPPKGQWRAAALSHFPAVQKVEKLPGCPAAYFQRSSDSACHHERDPERTGSKKAKVPTLVADT